jgi:hypothetical protein
MHAINLDEKTKQALNRVSVNYKAVQEQVKAQGQ